MLQAAAEKVVDFENARLCDGHWWARFALLMDALDRKNQRQFLEVMHQRSLLQALVPNLSKTTFEGLTQIGLDIYEALSHTYIPSAKENEKGRQRQMIHTSRDAWREAFGDPDDPQTAAKIEATADAILQHAAEARKPAIVRHKR